MGATVACFGLVIATIVMILASLAPDEEGLQSVTILGAIIFAFSFPLAPLFVKLGIVALIAITWPWFGDRLSGALYRHLRK
ncbi:MAG: hypothetical protein QNJ41_06930 [Xenococcaceae cyanobacterium MO_188.B32]|nr:hypothetical protein [Xenococcaceae cyanobacterium MO_188.B32]